MKTKTKLDNFDDVFAVAFRAGKSKSNPLHNNSVVVKCNADGSWLSYFESNGRAIFTLIRSNRMILRADDARLEPYFDAPYEVRDITVTPD